MAEVTTPNLGLEHYDPDEIFTFAVHNSNMDKIDQQVTNRYDVILDTAKWVPEQTWWRQPTSVVVNDGDIVEITNISPSLISQLTELGVQLLAENNAGNISILAIGEQPNVIINLSILSYKVAMQS